MKRNLLFLGVAFISTLLFTACSDDDNAAGSVPTNSLEVTINGTKKSFSNVQGRWVDGGSYLELTATNDGNEWVSVTVLSETTRVPVGTYTLDDGSPFSILSVYNLNSEGSQQNYTATKGTAAPEDAFILDIEKISNSEASGTFSGTLVSVEGLHTTGIVTFTNGKFNVAIKPN